MRKQFEWSNALQMLENECKEAHEAEETQRDKYKLVLFSKCPVLS